MKRISFFFGHLLMVALFLSFGCAAGERYSSISGKSSYSKRIGHVEQGTEIVQKAYDMAIKNYVDPVGQRRILVGALKGIESLVGTTGLLLEETDRQVVVSPLTKKPFRPSNTSQKARQTLGEIHQYVVNKKPGYSPMDIAYSAIKGMMNSLDPHSAFLPPEAYKDLQIETKGHFSGIGIVITMQDNAVTVISPIEGATAYKAGIKPGDKIIKVDGEQTMTMTLWEVVKKMRGKGGSSVVITVRRKGLPELIDFTIVRDIIPQKSVWSYVLKPGYGYVRISHFAANVCDDVKAALKKLESGDPPLRGLILDLRNNPGGFLGEAVKVADIFLDEGGIVSIKGRLKTHSKIYVAHRDKDKHLYPIVLLINEGSASASEIVGGALQDHGRALVLGTTSFGKGSVQSVDPLPDGSAIKLTIARYYTPNGHPIQPRGIIPDVLVGPYTKLTTYLHENDLTPWELDQPNHVSKTIPVIYVDPLDEEAILNTALEIFERSHSNRLSDLLASAKQIIIESGQKPTAGPFEI